MYWLCREASSPLSVRDQTLSPRQRAYQLFFSSLLIPLILLVFSRRNALFYFRNFSLRFSPSLLLLQMYWQGISFFYFLHWTWFNTSSAMSPARFPGIRQRRSDFGGCARQCLPKEYTWKRTVASLFEWKTEHCRQIKPPSRVQLRNSGLSFPRLRASARSCIVLLWIDLECNLGRLSWFCPFFRSVVPV